MAKKNFHRYLSIINLLQRKSSTFEEIDAYLHDHCDIASINYNFSRRTFQRDIKEIAELHSIEITYSRVTKCYKIVSSEEHHQERVKQRLLDNAQMNFALQIYNKAEKWIDLEQGSTFTAVSGADIKSIEIPVPSLPEQTKIANFLSALDEKIGHCGGQIDKMEQWKKGLLQGMFC